MDIKEKVSCTKKGPFFINLDTEHVNKKLKILSPAVDKSNSQDASTTASTAASTASTAASNIASTVTSNVASTATPSVASQISITKSEDSWAMVEQNMISEAKSEDSWMLVD
ncbi:predicted protein [Chaetoceros tenuissimus]|jgi:hypothetical protein|uniref:Uncharacterized protein n=1 Tax=Chaetoceros tenuissimus TaxID=426638 RepID=A0AAD3CR60_9STRA|nr:predicted protein [Chaetoceros tenuissimus]